MSKLLTNQISNYNDNGPVEVKDGINVASGKPLQVAGANGTSGDYLKIHWFLCCLDNISKYTCCTGKF